MEIEVGKSEEPPEAIVLDNIHKTYLLGTEGIPALRGVNISIRKGEFLAVYGTSGGGKTTLLNIAGTIDTPTKGHLSVFGNRITGRTKDRVLAALRLEKMGFVFQTFNLISSMTARENVELPLLLAGKMTKKQRRNRVDGLLKSVGILSRAEHYPNQLSGGEQQRVTIARAIANNPEVLLLDEPTGDLDTVNTLMVMDMLLGLNEKENITLVMVTHDPSLKNIAHRVIYVRDGKIHGEEIVPERVRGEEHQRLTSELEQIVCVPPMMYPLESNLS